MAAEDLFLVVAVTYSAELVAHAILHNHGARHIGRLLDVVRGAGRHIFRTKDELFRYPAAKHHGEIGFHLMLFHAVAVAFWKIVGHAESAPSRDNGHLVEGIIARHKEADER